MEDLSRALEENNVLLKTLKRQGKEGNELLYGIDKMLRVFCTEQGKPPSSLGLHIPGLPIVDSTSQGISPAASGISAESTSSYNISRMFLDSSQVAGPSGTSSGNMQAQGKSSSAWTATGRMC
jgi:hypothetical protein